MKLDITGKIIDKPSLEQIIEVIHDEKRRGEYFILSKSDSTFLQATGPNDQLIVEYREDNQSDMYSAASLLTCAQLQELCEKYITGESDWSAKYEWKAMGFI